MRKIFSQCQGIIRRQRKMEKLIDEKDFIGAFGIRPRQTPIELRKENVFSQPSGISLNGSRVWTFG